jgi:hypothetical protein
VFTSDNGLEQGAGDAYIYLHKHIYIMKYVYYCHYYDHHYCKYINIYIYIYINLGIENNILIAFTSDNGPERL